MHLAQFLTVKILNNGHFNISINYSLHLAYFINVSKEILICTLLCYLNICLLDLIIFNQKCFRRCSNLLWKPNTYGPFQIAESRWKFSSYWCEKCCLQHQSGGLDWELGPEDRVELQEQGHGAVSGEGQVRGWLQQLHQSFGQTKQRQFARVRNEFLQSTLSNIHEDRAGCLWSGQRAQWQGLLSLWPKTQLNVYVHR